MFVFNNPHSPTPSLRRILSSGFAAALLFAGTATAQVNPGQNPPAPEKNVSSQVQNEISIALPSLSPLVERTSPAVVTISAQVTNEAQAQNETGNQDNSNEPSQSMLDDMLRKFFENRGMHPPGREITALGSGFIVDPAGFIVTNNHVVGVGNKITAVLQDGSRHEAKIVGRDDKTDIALVKIDAPQKLPYVAWGDSAESKVGDWVVAVGNPFGLGGSVTAGIISAIGRNIHEGPYDDFIQIDAPINRGNSGGPTFNLKGQVIGINTAIYSPSGGSVGIGFAIPAAAAKPVVAELQRQGHVTRGWLGVAVQAITPPIAKGLGLDPNAPTGTVVAAVTPDSPAAKAGIRAGDVILGVDGQPIKGVADLPRRIANTSVGKQIDLAIRRSGKDITLQAQVGEMQENNHASVSPAVPEKEETKTTGLGVELSRIDSAARRQFRIPREVEGVVVSHVSDSSPLADIGVETGDVIVSVDQQPAKTPEQTADLLNRANEKGNVLVLLNRHGSSQFIGVNTGSGSGSTAMPR